jgi:predicted N-acetyltransferase YhbS
MAFRVRGLQKGELDGLLACFQAAFGVDEESISIVRNSLVNDPYFHPDRVRVGLLNGDVVSCTVILHRGVYVGNQVVTVAGVTAVATQPAYQGRGFGGRVVQDAVRLIRQQGYDMAMLTTRLPRFFARFGFREVPKVNGYECAASALARMALTDSYEVQRIDYNRHWPAVAAVYQRYSLGRTGLQVRESRFWETWPRRGTFPHGLSSRLGAIGMLATTGDSAAAYVAAHIPPDQPHLGVTELAHLPEHEDAALVLLRVAAQEFVKSGSGRAVMHIGGNAPVLAALQARRIATEVETGPGLMVLIPSRGWVRGAGFRNVDQAIEHLFRSSPPVLWMRDGY